MTTEPAQLPPEPDIDIQQEARELLAKIAANRADLSRLVKRDRSKIRQAELKALADPELRVALDEAKNPDRSEGRSRGSFAQHADHLDG